MENFLLLIVLVLLSGFFSGIELAYFSLSEAKLQALIEKNVPGALLIRKLKARPERLLITILIGNNVVNIGSSAYATFLATEQFGSEGVGIATGAMTLLILTFGEIIPKSISTNFAAKICQISAPPLYVLTILLWPVSYLFVKLSQLLNALLRKTSSDSIDDTSHEEELSALAKIGLKEGGIEQQEYELIKNVFEFNDEVVEKVMTPLEDVVAVPADAVLNKYRKEIIGEHHSRIPVYSGSRDNIIGVLYRNDLFDHIDKDWKKIRVSELAKPPIYVSASDLLDDIFELLREERTHMAIVLSEGVSKSRSAIQAIGIVTLEDLIEEILGEIEDETDEPE